MTCSPSSPRSRYDIKMLKKIAAIAAGGLFNVRIEGTGLIAITSHYDPLTLPVTPDAPITTDPNATVMWSGSLTPKIKTDVQLKSLIGRGSGESVQMEFVGDGFVVVQPYEEVIMQRSRRQLSRAESSHAPQVANRIPLSCPGATAFRP